MKNLTVNTYMANICVNSKHGSNLEFVLDAAEERANKRGKPYNTFSVYTNYLYDMLKKEFDKSNSGITDICEYGDISFTIEADTPEQLQKAIIRADKVIKKWLNKYNIEKMKANK